MIGAPGADAYGPAPEFLSGSSRQYSGLAGRAENFQAGEVPSYFAPAIAPGPGPLPIASAYPSSTTLRDFMTSAALQEFLDERGPALERLRERLMGYGQDPAALLDGARESFVPLWWRW